MGSHPGASYVRFGTKHIRMPPLSQLLTRNGRFSNAKMADHLNAALIVLCLGQLRGKRTCPSPAILVGAESQDLVKLRLIGRLVGSHRDETTAAGFRRTFVGCLYERLINVPDDHPYGFDPRRP